MALAILGLCLGVGLSSESRAGWLSDAYRQTSDRVVEFTRNAGLSSPDDWQDAIAIVRQIPERISAGSVAATVSGEGHWMFANRSGQRFTVANAREMQRVEATLFPNGIGPNGLTVYLTPRSVFLHREQMVALPGNARLRLVSGRLSYALRVRRVDGDRQGLQLVAAVRADVLVPVKDRRTFAETVWQLERPLAQVRPRVIALVEGGPAALPPTPSRRLPSDSTLPIERIAPVHLRSALRALRGQWAVLTGRIEEQKVIIRTADGAETALDLDRLKESAKVYDVGLAILNARAPRQPGARNWLWQKVDIDGLAQALKRTNVADFLGSLALAGGKVEVRGKLVGDTRVNLSVVAVPGGLLPTSPSGLVGLIAEFASEVVGTVVTSTVQLDLVSSLRARELGWRIIPGVPSIVQVGFIGLLLLGLLAWPVAGRWWRGVWPPEAREDYGDRTGFYAARCVRMAAFVLLFLPVVSVVAVLRGLFGVLGGLIMAPFGRLRGSVREPSGSK